MIIILFYLESETASSIYPSSSRDRDDGCGSSDETRLLLTRGNSLENRSHGSEATS